MLKTFTAKKNLTTNYDKLFEKPRLEQKIHGMVSDYGRYQLTTTGKEKLSGGEYAG